MSGQTGAISQADFNDQEILDNTRQENAANGAFRFHYTLPSGRTMCSEWVSPDNRRGAAMNWCVAVREQMAADVRGILEKKVGTAPKKSAPAIVVPEELASARAAENMAAQLNSVIQSTDEPDVEVYLSTQLERAKRRYAEAINSMQLAEEELKSATAALTKVRKAIAAMAQE